MEVDRKKPFSSLERELFLNIIEKYKHIISCKQTNGLGNPDRKKQTWDKIQKEFNESTLVIQKASTKQLTKLWYNMKAKARDSKTKENVRHMTGGGPSIMDMDAIDTKVIEIDKNILTNIVVDIDSDIDGSVPNITGDINDFAWSKTSNIIQDCNDNYVEENKNETEFKTPKDPYKKGKANLTNNIDLIKMNILEEELDFKKKLHEHELNIKKSEEEHKKQMWEIELKIKLKELEKLEKE